MNILYYIVYGFCYLSSLLPFRVHYLFSDFLYLVIYKVFGYRTDVVRSNLSSSFPEKSAEELRQIERRFYHNLCDCFVETIKSLTISKEQMRKHMVFKNMDIIDECFADGQSIVLYIGHLFNWEWITSIPLWGSSKGQFGQLYHALENPIFDRLTLTCRNRWGSINIPLVNILRKTIEFKQKNIPTAFGYLGDQVPHWNNIHHWCQFLNHDTPVMSGAERIAIKNHQAMVYFDMHRVKRGYYELEVKLITRKPEELKEYESIDIYFKLLEENIRREPDLWLWSHNRWKRTREEFNERFVVINGKVVPKEEAK